MELLGNEIAAGNSVVFIVVAAIPATVPEDSSVQLLQTMRFVEYNSYPFEFSGIFFEFEYDEQNRITNIAGETNYDDIDQTLGYDGDDVVSILDGEGVLIIPKPADNIITLTGEEEYGTWTQTYELNEQGYLSYFLEEDHFSLTYEYQDGNVVKVTKRDDYGSKDIQRITTYTYDNNKSPFYNCKTPKWFLFAYFIMEIPFANQNNITSVTIWHPEYEWEDWEGNTHVEEDWEETFTLTYTYDAAGFPLTVTYDWGGTTTFTYLKK